MSSILSIAKNFRNMYSDSELYVMAIINRFPGVMSNKITNINSTNGSNTHHIVFDDDSQLIFEDYRKIHVISNKFKLYKA